jgi:tRNA threonylcarbamoyladenosine biosynthesis protein TsaB
MILALDTATTPSSVVLANQAGDVCASYVFATGEQPAATLFSVVAQMLAKGGITFADVTLLAVCRGPGSFTGIRIALAAVAGLQLATGCAVAVFSTLEAYAAAAVAEQPEAAPVRVRVPDGAGGAVEQDFDAQGAPLTLVQAINDAEDLPAGWRKAGFGWGVAPLPLAAALARLAALGRGGETVLTPLYLRPSYAEVAAERASCQAG